MNTSHLSPGIAVDIDETLCSTGAHWMQEFLNMNGSPANIDAKDAIRRHWYYGENLDGIPREKIRSFFDERVYSAPANRAVPLIENANHVIQKVDVLLPISCYLTARPEVVRQATEEWLEEHGFPNRPVVMRPGDFEGGHLKGNLWKSDLLSTQYPTIRGIIDDNPNLIKELPEGYPGTIFLYDHLEYPHDTKINVIPCKDWNTIYLEISRMARLFGITCPRP